MIIRQGDILLVKIEDSGGALRVGKPTPLIVGHGETTGHTHTIEAARALTGDELAWDLFARTGDWQGNGDPLVAVDAPTIIRHQEHDALPVPAGVYRVVRQRVYAPEAPRSVLD